MVDDVQTTTVNDAGGVNVADELVQRRLERMLSSQHVLAVLTKLADRSRRHDVAVGRNSSFISGMRSGYIQSIALILDCTYDAALHLVQDGFL